jgi:hypothetical protein
LAVAILLQYEQVRVMSFVENASDIAADAMNQIDSTLSVKYATVIEFLCDNPDMAASRRGKKVAAIGTLEYIKAQALDFKKGRDPKKPEPSKTVPDEMVSFILQQYFDFPDADLEKAVDWHLLSMKAENIVGELLERYIAHVIEDDSGWVWCSGSVVKAVDFIYRDRTGQWVALQVKNRDNSENSSSSAIRKNTSIKKWYRTFSKKQGDNWQNFPLETTDTLSEENFKAFVKTYLKSLKGEC